MGLCRFHRGWAEEMIPEIMDSLYGLKEQYLKQIAITATRINSRNASIFWESQRNIDYVYTFLKKMKDIEKVEDENLDYWVDFFERDKAEAALSFWYEIHKGITESLKEF
jgi:glyceraldehyde-3-phosphate dehydrogenase (ferredoxin)